MTGESCAILPHPGTVRALAFSPDSSWLVSGCHPDESLQIWNVATARLENKFKGPGSVRYSGNRGEPGRSPHRGCGFRRKREDHRSRDRRGSPLLSDGRGASARRSRWPTVQTDDFWRVRVKTSTQIDIRDTQTHRRSARLTGHTGAVFSVAFSGDGRLLASASGDRTVRVWDVAAAKCVAVLTGHTDQVFSAVFHPDGKRLASAGRDRAIWLWDLATRPGRGPAGGTHELRLLPGVQPGRQEPGVRFRRRYGPDLGHRVAGARDIRPDAKPRPCGPRPRPSVARLFAELHEPTEVVARLRADASLSDLAAPRGRAGSDAPGAANNTIKKR